MTDAAEKTAQQLDEWIEQNRTPIIEPKTLTIGEAYNASWPERDYIFGPLQPGDVGMISGADGSGKSWIAMAAALTVAYGRSACNIFPAPDDTGRVIYYAGEDRYHDHGIRLQTLAREISYDGIFVDEGDERMTLTALQGKRIPLFAPLQLTDRSTYAPTNTGQHWAESIADFRLVVLDPLRMFHDLIESDGVAMDGLIRWLVSVAMANEQAIILVHHSSQDAVLGGRVDHHTGRGATDLPAGCRGIWTLHSASKDSSADKTLTPSKASHTAEGEPVELMRCKGGPLRRMVSQPSVRQSSATEEWWGGKHACPF